MQRRDFIQSERTCAREAEYLVELQAAAGNSLRSLRNPPAEGLSAESAQRRAG